MFISCLPDAVVATFVPWRSSAGDALLFSLESVSYEANRRGGANGRRRRRTVMLQTGALKQCITGAKNPPLYH